MRSYALHRIGPRQKGTVPISASAHFFPPMSAAHVRRVGWRGFPPLCPLRLGSGTAPPPAPRRGQRGVGSSVPSFSRGGAGAKTPANIRKPREKEGTEPNSEGEVWGSIWGRVARLPSPFAPVQCWPNGETLWHCKFMRWRSIDQKKVFLVRYPIGRLPLYVCRCSCRCPCP